MFFVRSERREERGKIREEIGRVTNLDWVVVKGDHIPWRLVELAHVGSDGHRNGATTMRGGGGGGGGGGEEEIKLGVLTDPHGE